MILVGVNNRQDSAPDVAAGIKAVVAKTQAMFAGIKVILVSVLPNGPSTPPNSPGAQKAADVNKITRTFADDRSVYYLDLASKMTPGGQQLEGHRIRPSARHDGGL